MKQLFALTLLAAAIAAAQDAPKMNARELFYGAPPPTPAAQSQNKPAGSTAKQTTTAASNTSTANQGRTAAGSGNPNAGTAQTAQGKTSSSTTASNTTPSGGANTVQPNTGAAHAINVSSTTGFLGLRYAVLKRDTGGSFKEIDPDTAFHTGDAIRLHVEANAPGYLYVVNQGASGQWQLLFPRPDVNGGSNRVDAHVQITVPSEKAQWKFDEHAGTEKLFVVLARQPERDLDKLIYSIQGGGNDAAGQQLLAQNTIGNDVVDRMRNKVLSRDLVFDKVDENTTDSAPVKNETAAYVVSTSTAPDARLVQDFSLQHR